MEGIKNLDEFRDNKKEKVEEELENVIDMLSVGNINDTMKMFEEQNISDSIINSPEIQEIVKKTLLHTLPKGYEYVHDAVLFGKMFNVPKEDMFEIAQKAIKNEEAAGKYKNVSLIKEEFGISDEDDDNDNTA